MNRYFPEKVCDFVLVLYGRGGGGRSHILSITGKSARRGSPNQPTIEILPEGAGDFLVRHFLPVLDFI
jgi:chromosomal replication initiation ATPase DnaA